MTPPPPPPPPPSPLPSPLSSSYFGSSSTAGRATTLVCIHPRGFNIGNLAIHVALRRLVFESFGEVVNIISIPATSRFESNGRAGLTAGTVHEINRYADGVLIGGGNLLENGQLDVDLEALDRLEPPMAMVSLSRGRVYNRRGELVDRTDVMPDRAIRALHDKALLSLARDPATHEHAVSIGATNSVVGGCPTVAIDELGSRLPELSASDRGGALVSVRTPELMNIPLGAQARVHGLVRGIVDELRGRGVGGNGRVRLLCHDHRDIPFAASVEGVEFVYTDDVHEYLALLRGCDLNVSFRLHATIPCLAFGTPVVNVSYDERGASLLGALGLGDGMRGGWDVGLMDGDAMAQIRGRLDAMDNYPAVAMAAGVRRREMRRVIMDGLNRFRDAVRTYGGGESWAAAQGVVEAKPTAWEPGRAGGMGGAPGVSTSSPRPAPTTGGTSPWAGGMWVWPGNPGRTA